MTGASRDLGVPEVSGFSVRNATGTAPTRARLADLIRNISYEIVPLKGAEEAVVTHVPRDVPLTVTAAAAKDVSATVDLADRLSGHGYTAAPHLPARLVREGHTAISDEALWLALKHKAPYATHLITQMCFDAVTTAGWAAAVANNGFDVPVVVGMPGPVSRQKLMRVSAGLGLGQSARFLRKQQNVAWRFLLPGGYNPTRLVRRLGRELPQAATHVRGIHIYTFNELAKTEQWRRTLLASVPAGR